jgi:hypothetical protein
VNPDVVFRRTIQSPAQFHLAICRRKRSRFAAMLRLAAPCFAENAAKMQASGRRAAQPLAAPACSRTWLFQTIWRDIYFSLKTVAVYGDKYAAAAVLYSRPGRLFQ